MPLYRASTVIDAPPERVWEALLDWEGSARWMAPPTTVEVLGERRTGIGTRLRAVSVIARVVRLIDVMVVTEWTERRLIRVRHVGWMVRGDGIFRLTGEGGGTRFEWIEDFVFPLGIFGELAGALLRPVAQHYLRRSCARLALMVTG